jgi:peptidoglycan/LPS O-acetylase OafA/YrhL
MGGAPESTLSYDAYRSRKYLPELDGLRALSVLIVITVHMHDHIWEWLGGHSGVTVFFVLSGYLITSLALREERQRGALSQKAFYIRRCFRIFPLYYFTLALYLLVIFGVGINRADKGPLLMRALPWDVFYMQEVPFYYGVELDGVVYKENIPFYHSWSLGIEEKFYLLWPLLAFVLWRGWIGWRIGGTLFLALLLAIQRFPLGYSGHDQLASCLYQYYYILIGCLLAFGLEDEHLYQRLRSFGAALWVYLSLTVMLALHFLLPHLDVAQKTWAEPLFGVSVVVFLACLLCSEGSVRRVLGWWPLAFVGRLSYGIYLIHVLCLNVAQRIFKPSRDNPLYISIAAYLLTCVLSIGVAYVLFRLIEKPLIEIGRRWSKRVLAEPVAKPLAATVP